MQALDSRFHGNSIGKEYQTLDMPHHPILGSQRIFVREHAGQSLKQKEN
jgi:hypothetical protein